MTEPCKSRFLDNGTIYECALLEGHDSCHDSHPKQMREGCMWTDEAELREIDDRATS